MFPIFKDFPPICFLFFLGFKVGKYGFHSCVTTAHATTNVVYFRVMRRLCRREWNLDYAWASIHDNGHVIKVWWRLTSTAHSRQNSTKAYSKRGCFSNIMVKPFSKKYLYDFFVFNIHASLRGVCCNKKPGGGSRIFMGGGGGGDKRSWPRCITFVFERNSEKSNASP